MVDIVELLRSTKPNVYSDTETARARIDMRNMIELDERAATEIETLRSKLSETALSLEASESLRRGLTDQLARGSAQLTETLSRLNTLTADLKESEDHCKALFDKLEDATSRLDAAKDALLRVEKAGTHKADPKVRAAAYHDLLNALGVTEGVVENPLAAKEAHRDQLREDLSGITDSMRGVERRETNSQTLLERCQEIRSSQRTCAHVWSIPNTLGVVECVWCGMKKEAVVTHDDGSRTTVKLLAD